MSRVPARPDARPEDRVELLDQLRVRRRELVDHFAVEASVDDAGPAVSSLWPLMVIQTAIAAVEAEMEQGKP